MGVWLYMIAAVIPVAIFWIVFAACRKNKNKNDQNDQ